MTLTRLCIIKEDVHELHIFVKPHDNILDVVIAMRDKSKYKIISVLDVNLVLKNIRYCYTKLRDDEPVIDFISYKITSSFRWWVLDPLDQIYEVINRYLNKYTKSLTKLR